MDDDKFKDLLEDEELTALRLAALATKKKEQNLNKFESATAQPIGSIVTTPNTGSELASSLIPFVQSDRSGYNNNSWRKQNHSSRRRGGGSFPKSQRSNLIVISPITLKDGKDSEEKVPALVLPQHKWCNSGNEDSMSPKTLRRTGPTRFNRHGSDSESSDDESDYEHSDNDSGSNETILQDEPPEHFSHLSPGCDNLSDSVEKKRRLSFQSLDSDIKSDTFDKSEATSVYKSLKNSLYSDTNQDRYAVQQLLNDKEQTFNSSDENKFSNYNTRHTYNTKSSDISEDLSFKSTKSIAGKGKTCSDNPNTSLNDTAKMWQDTDISSSACYSKDSESSQVWQRGKRFRTDNFLCSAENQCISSDSKTHNDSSANAHYLTDSDLRLELKKRMQEMKCKTPCSEANEMLENRAYSQYNSWDRNRPEYSHKDNEVDSSCTNSFSETHTSSFLQQANIINQNFNRENNVEHASDFSRQRSCRSSSKERTTRGSFSSRDKNRFEYSSSGRRYDRSSSLDRNRNARSSSRGRRRRDRSSSRDETRHERSSSQGRIKRNEGRNESSLSPTRNKIEHSYKHNKTNGDRSATKERRDWYKSSPKEKPEWSSGPDRSRRDCSSSSESKRERSTSQDRNKFSSSNSIHEKKHYENNLSRSRRLLNSKHDRNRHERSSSRDRSRHGSSRSIDSRSERSSSAEKHRRSSSREGSKDEQSSSENESRYRSNSRSAYNAFKFSSNQQKIKNDIVNQKTSIKANESNQDVVQKCSKLQNKLKGTLKAEKLKDEESKKVNTKDQDQNQSERSNSREKLLSSRKTHEKHDRMKNPYKSHYSRSRSSSSESCSSSYSSSSSHSCRPKIRSVPSVIKPVVVKSDTESRGNISENKSSGKSTNSTVPQSTVLSICTKRNLDNAENNKPSNIKFGRMDGDSKASEGKRVPVHMRLGAFPRKRVIQMPKDVEAAFVNSSSSSDGETVNTKCKRQNIRIVTDMYDAKNRIDLIQQKYSSDDKSSKRPSPDTYKEKFKRVKAHR